MPEVANSWKGVLNNGKTGLFNPAHTVSYLGNILPSIKPQFSRGGTYSMDNFFVINAVGAFFNFPLNLKLTNQTNNNE